ncbi:class I SAM-dependent methyltransferase [Candidatus Cyanaurora vandensis]|uniref:class I SAM-dependent methyltransferase n=1 Tax=Candidatus Cyanaurora vandensis TaxID=2714958 RepID=UPI00257E5F6E|nr:class I SAM-dependent methyltransferase [Candidatus Cyanaurora vandensis]
MTARNSFTRTDETDDQLFYQSPRLVQHIDDGFIQKLQQLFQEVLPPKATILDLMSSWVSHLPADLPVNRVVGLGMNEVELAANPQLQAYTVQNLNQNPVLPYPDQTFDAVLNTVSIQYVTRPLELMREVHRVLKPGGVTVVSFSNRMFPTKAVEAWRDSSDEDHVQLVTAYFTKAGGFTQIRAVRQVAPRTGNFMDWFTQPQDPFYAVVAEREAQ